jgi:hypothetical protein
MTLSSCFLPPFLHPTVFTLPACPDTCYVNCTFNHNGKAATFDDPAYSKGSNYGTSIIGNLSVAFIEETMASGRPFLVVIASHAPHGPATPAPWYADLYSGKDVIAPRTPAYNVHSPDKHWVVATQPKITSEYEGEEWHMHPSSLVCVCVCMCVYVCVCVCVCVCVGVGGWGGGVKKSSQKDDHG